MAAPPPSSVLADVTVDDADALDCGVCFLPLKAPIFQCKVGHVVCAPCHDSIVVAGAGGKCHVCGGGSSRTFRRCHAMERLVDAIRVPCPHVVHGCAARPAYHARDAHAQVCARAPCRCPGEACGFAAPTAELLHHLGADHGWPCSDKWSVGEIVSFTVELRDGFNFVRAGASTARGERRYHLFLLNVAARADVGRAVNVVCIQPHGGDMAPSTEMKFELEYTRYVDTRGKGNGGSNSSCSQLVNHYQKSEFLVSCTDLTDGLPDPNDGFVFVVPWSVLGDDGGEDTMQVTASAYLIIS